MKSDDLKTLIHVENGSVTWSRRPFPDGATDGQMLSVSMFNTKHAGKPARWLRDLDGLVYISCMKQKVGVADVIKALDLPDTFAEIAEASVDNRNAAKLETYKRRAVLNRVTLDASGVPVWRVKTEENAPKTPPERRERFNAEYAGKPLRRRIDADGGPYYKVQPYVVAASDMKKILSEI